MESDRRRQTAHGGLGTVDTNYSQAGLQTLAEVPCSGGAGRRGERGGETVRRRLRRRERKAKSHRTQTRTLLMYPVPHAGLTSTLRGCTQGVQTLNSETLNQTHTQLRQTLQALIGNCTP
jgi:uncharacterized protein YraI